MGLGFVRGLVGAALLAGSFGVGSAQAASIDVTFGSSYGPGALHIVYGAANGGGFDITSVSGNLAIFTISGPYTDTGMGANNILYEAAPFLDGNGVGIDMNGGLDRGVIYYDGANYIMKDNGFLPAGGLVLTGMSEPFATTVSPGVPEASTWAMMVLGFAGLGALAWRQSKRTPATA